MSFGQKRAVLQQTSFQSVLVKLFLPAQNPSVSGLCVMYCQPCRLVWLQKAWKFSMISLMYFTGMMISEEVQNMMNLQADDRQVDMSRGGLAGGQLSNHLLL